MVTSTQTQDALDTPRSAGFVLSCCAVALGLTAAGAHADTVLLHDDFEDGNRTDPAWWLVSPAGSMDVNIVDDAGGIGTGNVMQLSFESEETANRGTIVVNFPDVQLTQVGDWVRLRFNVRATGTGMRTERRGFRFGLYDTASDQLDQDGINIQGSGYTTLVTVGTGDQGHQATRLMQQQDTLDLTVPGTGDSIAQGVHEEAAIYNTDSRLMELLIERTGSEPGDLYGTLTVDDIYSFGALLSVTDGAAPVNTSTFNTFAVRTLDTVVTDHILLDNVSITSNVPEPAALTLLTAGSVLLIGRSRRHARL